MTRRALLRKHAARGLARLAKAVVAATVAALIAAPAVLLASRTVGGAQLALGAVRAVADLAPAALLAAAALGALAARLTRPRS